MADMSDATPDRAPTPAPPPDEISLRELYLVLKRRAPWIVAAAAVAAVAAGLFLTSRAPTYVAEATAVVARAPIEVDLGTSLRFRPEVNLTYDTYQTLAFSRGVLEELALERSVEVAELRRALTLERVTGASNQATSFLAVAHQVADRDPQRAAQLANLWAEATVRRARDLLLENLDAVEVITGEGLDTAREALLQAEIALQDYTAQSAIEALRSRAVALLETETEVVSGQRAARLSLTQLRSELQVLQAQRLDDGTGDLPVVLTGAPEVTLTLDGAIASVQASVAGLEARLAAWSDEVERLAAERSTVALELAQANVRLGQGRSRARHGGGRTRARRRRRSGPLPCRRRPRRWV
jgi:uncharacterized protein involved in exopolysaccharide biosynthesis